MSKPTSPAPHPTTPNSTNLNSPVSYSELGNPRSPDSATLPSSAFGHHNQYEITIDTTPTSSFQSQFSQFPPPSIPVSPSPAPPPTDNLPDTLSPTQQIAIQLIYANATIPQAAAAAGVSTRTVYRWIETDPEFAALYNAWQSQVFSATRSRALAAHGTALDTVIAAIQSGNASIALRFLNLSKVLAAQPPSLTDPDEIRRRSAIKQSRKQKRLAAAEQKLGLHIPKVPRTLAEVEEAMGPLAELRDEMILRTEERWCHYLKFKHLSPDEYQAHYQARQRPHGPPPEPRPSWRQFLAALERECKRHNWDFRGFVSMHARARREAEQSHRLHSTPPSPSPSQSQSQSQSQSNSPPQLSAPPPPPSETSNVKSDIPIARPHSPNPTPHTGDLESPSCGNRESAIDNPPPPRIPQPPPPRVAPTPSSNPTEPAKKRHPQSVHPNPEPYVEPDNDMFIPYNPDRDSIEKNRW